MKHLAVFASGNGTNYEAIENAFFNSQECCVSILICDNPNAYVLKRAEKFQREIFVFSSKEYESKTEYEAAIVEKLRQYDIDLICLAGYMRIIGETLLEAYPDKIINIHPALLPSFKGRHGIEDAFNYGVKVYGVTVHYVSKEVDGGRIIAQRAFEYDGCDITEVEAKIHEIEHDLYPQTIKKLLKEYSNESIDKR